MPRRSSTEAAKIVEEVVGDIIDELVEKYYSDKVDEYVEYEELLAKIADEITRVVFKGKATVDDIEAYLYRLREKKGYAKLILSYLIGRALELREEVEGYMPVSDNTRT
ncbi:hypothetical protein [Desulfurococcus mucosus]|uniref:Uncharacterized protein n=1 Tax=Desulfurococcus mucosus (strain ATCC 35584 / DSM 2162 / JCM 9187 / O7/1) TaxID=765177 RepID=E8RA05_DESM0|nr:hypothetical protein [Desulfurococcus mucosus]ADV65331.1 hypothetical protein Desmu_1029 [Desulfurococcus mucosus DSM 2162]